MLLLKVLWACQFSMGEAEESQDHSEWNLNRVRYAPAMGIEKEEVNPVFMQAHVILG